MAIPVISRDAGFLLAIPSGYVLPHALVEAADSTDDNLLGPSKEMSGPLLEEDEDGTEHVLADPCRFLLVDVSNDALQYLREYDPVTDPLESIQPYSAERPLAIADIKSKMAEVLVWIEEVTGNQRLNFYSAREEQTGHLPKATPKKAGQKRVTAANQVETLTSQLQLLATQQEELMKAFQAPRADPAGEPLPGLGRGAHLPAVSTALQAPPSVVAKTAKLVGPPPRTKGAPVEPPAITLPDRGESLEELGAHPYASALMQQSAALTSLVAHLTTGDAMADLSSSSMSGQSLSTKGVARREKMQQELSSGTSSFFLQLQQQIFKRMCPTRPLPRSEEELQGSGITLTSYLERFGGFRNKPESAMLMWLLAHCADAAASGDDRLVKEYLALTIASVDQSVLDGNWAIASLLCLVEEPPVQVYMDRATSISSLGRPFSPLVAPQWAAVSLAYLKEMELLNTKKTEARGGKAPQPKAPPEPGHPPSPKNPKYPKKPKAAAADSPPPKAAWCPSL